MDAPVVMVGWWWVSSYVVQGTREEIANAQETGKRAAGSNTGKESKPTTDEKKKTERQGAAAERKSESERKEREREREREAEEESAQWGPSGQWLGSRSS